MKALTTKQVIIRIAFIVSLVEFLIMLLLGITPLAVGIYSLAVLDLILLALLPPPLIYIWVIKPFVSSRDEALAQINRLAHTDPLTQLPNRRFLLAYLEKMIAGTVRHKIHGAVLLIDLDGFKDINDVYGHDAGDKVLTEIASRFRSSTRPEDSVGRMGGDEFIVLIHHIDADEQTAHDIIMRMADKLIKLASKPINFDGTPLTVGASIGIRLFGTEKLDVETAIREADIAMYRAKLAGRGRAVLFEKHPKGGQARKLINDVSDNGNRLAN